MKKFRILPLFLSLLLCLSLLTPTAFAANSAPSISGVDAVYVMNLEYGQAVYASNENRAC